MESIDRAQKENEQHLERSLKKVNLQPEAEITGFCLNCNEPQQDENRRWCDADCRDDWQKRNRINIGDSNAR